MILWEKGYSSAFFIHSIDPDSFSDRGIIGHVKEASLTRSIDGEAPTIDSGNATVTLTVPTVPAKGDIVRITFEARQHGSLERLSLATCRVLSCTVDNMYRPNERIMCDIELESLLADAAKAKIAEGWYCPIGADGAMEAASILRQHTIAPIVIGTGERPRLAERVVSGSDSALSMAWALLGDSWQMRIDGNGNIRIEPIQETGVTSRVAALALSDLCTYPAAKQSEETKTEDEIETVTVKETIEYERELTTAYSIGDYVQWKREKYRVISQRLNCGNGISMSETAERIISVAQQ